MLSGRQTTRFRAPPGLPARPHGMERAPAPVAEGENQGATDVRSTVSEAGAYEKLRWARSRGQTEGGEPQPLREAIYLPDAMTPAVPAALPRRERWLSTRHEDERLGGGDPLKRVVAAPYGVGQRRVVNAQDVSERQRVPSRRPLVRRTRKRPSVQRSTHRPTGQPPRAAQTEKRKEGEAEKGVPPFTCPHLLRGRV